MRIFAKSRPYLSSFRLVLGFTSSIFGEYTAVGKNLKNIEKYWPLHWSKTEQNNYGEWWIFLFPMNCFLWILVKTSMKFDKYCVQLQKVFWAKHHLIYEKDRAPATTIYTQFGTGPSNVPTTTTIEWCTPAANGTRANAF